MRLGSRTFHGLADMPWRLSKKYPLSAAMMVGLAIGLSTLRPAPPVTLSDVSGTNAILDNRPVWIVQTTRTQHTSCDTRIIERWFSSDGRRWQQKPLKANPKSLQTESGETLDEVGVRQNRVVFEQTRPVKGYYRVFVGPVLGCENGYETNEARVILELPFDWRDVKN